MKSRLFMFSVVEHYTIAVPPRSDGSKPQDGTDRKKRKANEIRGFPLCPIWTSQSETEALCSLRSMQLMRSFRLHAIFFLLCGWRKCINKAVHEFGVRASSNIFDPL